MQLFFYSYFLFASVGSRRVVADPCFHFLASGLPILEVLVLSLYCQKKIFWDQNLVVAARAPTLPVTPLAVNRGRC